MLRTVMAVMRSDRLQNQTHQIIVGYTYTQSLGLHLYKIKHNIT